MARATAFAIEPLLDAAQVGPGVRVLDVGCGPGSLSAAAAARGALVTGADLAEGMLAAARRNHPGIEFVHADAEDLPFEDGAFDVALGAFIVNHLPHPERAAAELARVAGRVALAMWGPADEVAILGLPARAAGDLATTAPPGPDEQRFTDAAALAALIGGSVHEIRRTLHVDTLDALWDGVRGGTVRTAARLAAATPGAAGRREGAPRRARRAVPVRDRLRAPDHDPHRRSLSFGLAPAGGTVRRLSEESYASLSHWSSSTTKTSRRTLCVHCFAPGGSPSPACCWCSAPASAPPRRAPSRHQILSRAQTTPTA